MYIYISVHPLFEGFRITFERYRIAIYHFIIHFNSFISRVQYVVGNARALNESILSFPSSIASKIARSENTIRDLLIYTSIVVDECNVRHLGHT